jgi:hypothetical protein
MDLIEYFNMALRSIEIYGAICAAAVMFYAIIKNKATGLAYFLAWGVLLTMTSYAFNRGYWMIGRWLEKIHGEQGTMQMFAEYSPLMLMGATVLFIVGAGLHISSMMENGQFWRRIFYVGALSVGVVTAFAVAVIR